MGVKLIDIDPVAVEAIQRAMASVAPAREKTVGGLGVPVTPVAWASSPPPRRRRRAGPAVLLIAAAASIALAVTHGRIPWLPHRSLAAAAPALVPAPELASVAPPAAPPSAEPVPVASASPVAAVAPADAATRATASAAGKPAPRPAPPRWWRAAPRRTGPSSDNPY
jgi:hypothetical protein